MWTVLGRPMLAVLAGTSPTQADELVSNLDESMGEALQVWSGQRHAQTFATGGYEPGYRIESVELDVAEWTDDADVMVSVHSAWSNGGPGDFLYRLENPARGTGRKVFTVRSRVGLPVEKYRVHSIVIRNLGEKGSFDLNTTSSRDQSEAFGWRIENGRWRANLAEDMDMWVGAAGVIKMRINSPAGTRPLSAAPDNIRIREEPRHLSISWDKVPDATGYYVQWRWLDEGFGSDRQEYLDGAESTSVRLRLAAGAGERHKVRVRATNGGADGPWSEDLIATPKMGLLVERIH